MLTSHLEGPLRDPLPALEDVPLVVELRDGGP